MKKANVEVRAVTNLLVDVELSADSELSLVDTLFIDGIDVVVKSSCTEVTCCTIVVV